MKIPSESSGQRLDRVVRDLLEAEGRSVSIREVRAAMKGGLIQINGQTVAPGQSAKPGAMVDASAFVAKSEAKVEPDPELGAQIPVLFEDDRILVLNKPPGLACHPLRPREQSSLLSAAIARSPAIAKAGPPLEGGLCHRLDRATSGCVIFAKDAGTRARVRRAFQAGDVDKIYVAIVHDPDQRLHAPMAIDQPLTGKGAHVRVETRGERASLPAKTEVLAVERLAQGFAWVKLRLCTGRRHQLRVHLAALGAPIAGDPEYGAEWADSAPRLALHALEIELAPWPRVIAPPPSDLQSLLRRLGGTGPS